MVHLVQMRGKVLQLTAFQCKLLVVKDCNKGEITMTTNQAKCSLLPKQIGDKAIKVTLDNDKKAGETARVILFVPAGGYVAEHSHAAEKNSDSEVYIDLLEIINKGVDRMRKLPEVAGSNSPTGKLVHSVQKSNQPQVFLAIKKDQSKKAWNDFAVDIVWYLKTLNFGCLLEGNKLIVRSNAVKDRKEVVEIDLVKNKINYWGKTQENDDKVMFETTTLEDLQNYTQKEEKEKN